MKNSKIMKSHQKITAKRNSNKVNIAKVTPHKINSNLTNRNTKNPQPSIKMNRRSKFKKKMNPKNNCCQTLNSLKIQMIFLNDIWTGVVHEKTMIVCIYPYHM